YGTFARAQSFDPLGNAQSEIRRGGLDAKMVIKDAVTIDAAIRPDFSEVESDDPLVRVNQRFEPFLPEKRPFFMENAALFDTPIKVFFSRRIVDPEVGIRTTARSAGYWQTTGEVRRRDPANSSGLARGLAPPASSGCSANARVWACWRRSATMDRLRIGSCRWMAVCR